MGQITEIRETMKNETHILLLNKISLGAGKVQSVYWLSTGRTAEGFENESW
jgi:hypothetical protein